MMTFIDTHTHLYDDDFDTDVADVIARAMEAGATKMLVPPTDLRSTQKALALCQQFPDLLHPMIGLHPEDVGNDYHAQLETMEQMLAADHKSDNPQFVAVGEVGLDYYWDKSHKKEQRDAFSSQLEWAARYRLPLMIHSRNAGNDLLECMRPWQHKLERGGVFHCFSGSIETANQLLNYHPRFYLGIGGVLTFKNSNLPLTAKHIPLERIVLETDSPYMAPTPMRGRRNEPAYIPYIINRLAEAKGITPEEVAAVTTRNAMQLFFGTH